MTSGSRLLSCLTAALALSGCAKQAPAPLEKKIEEVIGRALYKNSRWGLLVINTTTGKTVLERNADQLFAPASVTKLFTCAAALAELGAEHRFETPVYRRGKLEKGRLQGDLILLAKGDLTMGGRTDRTGKMAFTDHDHTYSSPTGTDTALTDTDPLAGLLELAKQVKAAGIKEVDGDVLVDARLWDRARSSGSGPEVVSPIVINDNLIDVVVKPGPRVGGPATWQLRPQTMFAQVDVHVTTVAKGEPTRIRTFHLGPRSYSVRGQIPLGGKPQVRICAVDDPPGFARALFIEALRREGVDVKVSVLRTPTARLPGPDAYASLTRVALFRSPPLSELLRVILKVSHNLYASTLPLLLAVKHDQRTQPEGMGWQGKALGKLGVDVNAISLESGAGGGNGDKLSPRAVVGLLQAMRKRPDWPAYEAGLPVLGVDGTLAAFGKEGPARGKVRGKTGTYTDRNLLVGRGHLRAKSLAGTMTTAKGQSLVFAIFVNDVPLASGVPATREGKAIAEVCEILQQHAT
jgi:D-alanyl-D-alanine carboxypeptidase/D-alanyl-D-alanine-endopeptidase (penicillin-binding protein 4)